VGLAATQHTMTNPLAVIDGDSATCRMYMQAHHVYEPDKDNSWFTLGGFYDDSLVRSDLSPTGWLLTGVKLTVLWRKGDHSIMALAREKGRESLAG